MNYKNLEKIYKALANHRRLAIIHYLNKGEKTNVSEIAEEIKLSLKSTSRHLQILKNIGLIEYEQKGLEKFYYLPEKKNIFIKQFLSLL